MDAYRARKSSLNETAQALSEIAEELSRISRNLAAQAADDETEQGSLLKSQESLNFTAQTLGHLSRQMHEHQRSARLRREILASLARRGPALPVELAAATLSLPTEIQPVLEEMNEEGLIEIRPVRGGQLVTLTAKGWQETRR